MKFRRWKLICAGIGAGIIGLLWWATCMISSAPGANPQIDHAPGEQIAGNIRNPNPLRDPFKVPSGEASITTVEQRIPRDSQISSSPIEAAAARGTVLDTEIKPGASTNQYLRVRLVQTELQPRPVRIVERWQLNTNNLSVKCLSREMFLSDQLIIKTPPNISSTVLSQRLAEAGIRIEASIGDHVLSVRLPRADLQAVPKALNFFAAHPETALSAELDGVGFGGGMPNDSRFGEQWGLHNTGQSGGTIDVDVDAPEFWDTVNSAPGMVIAVLDSGLNFTHPDLQNIAWSNPSEIAGDGIDNDSDGKTDDITGWDFVNNDNTPADDLGHGSNVTGIIAATRDNGQGIAGMLQGARILVCKVLNASNSGTTSNLIAAVTYARQRGVPIMNLSLQNYPFSSTLDDEFTACESAGIVLCICAGNQGVDNDVTPNYPSSYPHANIISVGNHDRTDVRWSGSFNPSNYGLVSVDLFAPGREILGPILGTDYSSYTGTSQATPFVTAVCAAIKYLHPSWSALEIKNRVLDSAIRVGSYQGLCVTGARLNAASALGIHTDLYGLDVDGPVVRLHGSTRIGSNRVVLKGTASDVSGVAEVDYKSVKGGYKKALGTTMWKASVPFARNKRSVIVKVQGIDTLGNRSKVVRWKFARP